MGNVQKRLCCNVCGNNVDERIKTIVEDEMAAALQNDS